MQEFYIYMNNEQKGPFSTTELKELMITRETMVWYEGAENWIKAQDVEELKGIFKSIPPPFQVNSTDTDSVDDPIYEDNSHKTEIIKPKVNSKRNKIIWVVASSLILIATCLIYILTNQSELENSIQEQNSAIQQQQSIEATRNAEKIRLQNEQQNLQKAAELESLKTELDKAITAYRASKLELTEIRKFKLLRTSEEKRQQIEGQLEKIRAWENEVERLNREIRKYQ